MCSDLVQFIMILPCFTGAWIETYYYLHGEGKEWRRAFTGAWIETPQNAVRWRLSHVAPSQARGLKHVEHDRLCSSRESRLHRRVD